MVLERVWQPLVVVKSLLLVVHEVVSVCALKVFVLAKETMAQPPRLKKRIEFVSVAQSQNSCKTATLVLQVLSRSTQTNKGEDLSPVRVGFTASRRVGGAVKRNRARRRLREAAKLVVPQFNFRHHDLVVIARASTVTAPFSAILRDLTYSIKHCLKRYDH